MMNETLLDETLLSFLRFLFGVTLLALVIFAVLLASFGLKDLYSSHVESPHLVCVKAHDEFHQTDNGTLVKLCDEWRRR